MRLTMDKQGEFARELVKRQAEAIGSQLVDELLNADQSEETGIQAQRERVAELKKKLKDAKDPRCQTACRAGGYAGEKERLDRRRRRLGV